MLLNNNKKHNFLSFIDFIDFIDLIDFINLTLLKFEPVSFTSRFVFQRLSKISKPIEHFRDIIDRIIDLKSSENRRNKTIKLETPEDKTNNIKKIKIKETIRN